MPTTLPRINLTVPKELNKILFQLAKRDRMSVSKKAMKLIEQAIEVEEDIWLGNLAEERLKKGGRLVPHEKAWLRDKTHIKFRHCERLAKQSRIPS